MDKNKITLKQIETVLGKKLKPISQKLTKLQQGQEGILTTVNRHSQTLEAHTESLVSIESTVKIVKDIWEFIKDHIRRIDNHEDRIRKLESSPKF